MDSRFIRRMNFRRDIQGKIISSMGLVFWCLLKARRLLDAHKELILSLLFFVLEAVSVVLDQIDKNEVAIHLAAFLLSAFGFAITLYSMISIIMARHDKISMAKKQLKVVDFVFSVIQLIVALIEYLQVKNDYNASLFSVAFAVISVVFVFIKGRKSTDSSPTLPITNFQKPTYSLLGFTPIEPDQIGTSTNQVNPPRSSTVKRHTHACKQARRLLDAHKELILSLLFLVLEAVSVVLDQIGKNKVGILLVALLLSAVGFAITLFSIMAIHDKTIMDEKQLKVVDFVFSVIQLIVASIDYLLKNDYNASLFSLAFAVISVVFVFIKGRKSTDSSPVLPIYSPKMPDGSSTTVPLLDSTAHEERESSPTVPLLDSTAHEEPESSPTVPLLDSAAHEEPESSPTDPSHGSTPNKSESLTTDESLTTYERKQRGKIVRSFLKRLKRLSQPKEQLHAELAKHKVVNGNEVKPNYPPPKFISPKVGLNPPPKFISPKVGLFKRKNFKLRR